MGAGGGWGEMGGRRERDAIKGKGNIFGSRLLRRIVSAEGVRYSRFFDRMTAQLGQNETKGWQSMTKVRKFVTVQACHGTAALYPLNEWRKM